MKISSKYIIQRVGMFLVTIWLGATLIFFIPRLAPGDPIADMIGRMVRAGANVENQAAMIAAWRTRFGLDDPLIIQYLKFLKNTLTFNFGYSLSSFPTQVQELVFRALPWTVGLLLSATLISFAIGNINGALIAWKRTPKTLRNLLPITLVFTAIPFFMLGILLMYVFGFILEWVPIHGAYDMGIHIGWNWPFVISVLKHSILPIAAIVISNAGFWALGMRGMMATIAGEDYMTLANAKGLSLAVIFWRYSIRNAILPQITALTLTIGGIAGGAILVETIFGYPGMGYLLYQAIMSSDYTLMQGVVIMLIFGTALGALIIDLLYPFIDPRISYEKG
jgi:peptide/nickel transport system permease protein